MKKEEKYRKALKDILWKIHHTRSHFLTKIEILEMFKENSVEEKELLK